MHYASYLKLWEQTHVAAFTWQIMNRFAKKLHLKQLNTHENPDPLIMKAIKAKGDFLDKISVINSVK